MNKDEKLPTPTEWEVGRYLHLWDQLDNYREQEHALEMLFRDYPCNTNPHHVLLRVVALNQFYSTNIFDVFDVSREIAKIDDFDGMLRAGVGDVEQRSALIEKISKCGPIMVTKSGEKSRRRIYSFATKYCSHQQLCNPGCQNRNSCTGHEGCERYQVCSKAYPIFDSFVDKVLNRFYKDENRFKVALRSMMKERKQTLRKGPLVLNKSYGFFVSVIECFQKCFELKRTVRDVDRYLWQLGKDWFPAKYGKNKDGEQDVRGVKGDVKSFDRFKHEYRGPYYYVNAKPDAEAEIRTEKELWNDTSFEWRQVCEEKAFLVWRRKQT